MIDETKIFTKPDQMIHSNWPCSSLRPLDQSLFYWAQIGPACVQTFLLGGLGPLLQSFEWLELADWEHSPDDAGIWVRMAASTLRV